MRETQGRAGSNLLLKYGMAGQFEQAAALYDERARLALAHPDEGDLVRSQATSALNLIASYVSADQYDKALPRRPVLLSCTDWNHRVELPRMTAARLSAPSLAAYHQEM
jgi:hypothetical protein